MYGGLENTRSKRPGNPTVGSSGCGQIKLSAARWSSSAIAADAHRSASRLMSVATARSTCGPCASANFVMNPEPVPISATDRTVQLPFDGAGKEDRVDARAPHARVLARRPGHLNAVVAHP